MSNVYLDECHPLMIVSVVKLERDKTSDACGRLFGYIISTSFYIPEAAYQLQHCDKKW
jgi:hypothetical protein